MWYTALVVLVGFGEFLTANGKFLNIKKSTGLACYRMYHDKRPNKVQNIYSTLREKSVFLCLDV